MGLIQGSYDVHIFKLQTNSLTKFCLGEFNASIRLEASVEDTWELHFSRSCSDSTQQSFLDDLR
jgi:hypothetical protein